MGKQNGIILIFTLVILLLLSLLGLTSAKTSRLQFLMTSNTQYQTLSLANAEDKLSQAEGELQSLRCDYEPLTPGTSYNDISLKNGVAANISGTELIDKDSDGDYCDCEQGSATCGVSCILEVYVLHVDDTSSSVRGAKRVVESTFAIAPQVPSNCP